MLIRDILSYHAKYSSDQVALTFLKGRNLDTTTFTFGQLHNLALKVAAQLLKNSCIGKKVGVPAANDIEFTVSLLGCLYVGAIAVPLPVAMAGLSNIRGDFIQRDAELEFVLCKTESFTGLVCNAQHIELNFNTSDILAFDELPCIADDSLALMQFTSGTGGEPAGVCISHRSLVKNLLIIMQAMGHNVRPDRVMLNWCPFYHDMGLIGGLLTPLFSGFIAFQLSPIDFLKRPLLLLKCIDQYRVTTCGGPTFSYQLLNTALNQVDMSTLSYDLSCWEVAFCGAEPVNAEILEEFCQHLAPLSFDKRSLLPCYGMAEFTLFISGASFQTGMKVKEFIVNGVVQRIVSCGRTYADTEIKIIDEQGNDLEQDKIGEICISGTSLLTGYSRKGQLIQKLNFNKENNRSFFATGDLGFISDNQIYITGRKKNLIKINGAGLFPHLVIQEIALSFPTLDFLKGIILQPNISEKKLFFFHELKRDVRLSCADKVVMLEQVKQLAKRLTGSTDIEYFIVKNGFLPKTTSGKLIVKNSESYVSSLVARLNDS